MVLFTNLLKNVSIQDCENMIYNWEFDDSVDFAPPHYRKSKYQKVEQLGKQIINEATALEYLEAFEYVEYLAVCLLQKDAIKISLNICLSGGLENEFSKKSKTF